MNVEPYIKTKYRLVANILYLLHFELIYLNKRLDLFPLNEKEYDNCMDGIIKGFEKLYSIDKEDREIISNLYKNA